MAQAMLSMHGCSCVSMGRAWGGSSVRIGHAWVLLSVAHGGVLLGNWTCRIQSVNDEGSPVE